MIERIRRLGTARVLAAAGALLLIATVGVGAVTATSGAPSVAGGATGPLATAAPAATGTRPAARALLRRTVVADLTVRTKAGFRTVHYIRGKVTAVTSSGLTITAADGTVSQFAVTSTTRVRSRGARVPFSQVAVGDWGLAFGTGTDGSYTASVVIVRAPGQAAGASGGSPAAGAPATAAP